MPFNPRLLLALALLCTPLPGQIHGKSGITLPAPPPTRTQPVTDTYVTTPVTDPYRWLEDPASPETRAFITAQNAYTQQYLSQLTSLEATRKQLSSLLRVDSYSTPIRRGDRIFFARRMASENQASIYLRNGLHGDDVRLIDASTLSSDQNTSVNILDITDDGSLLTYGLRIGGADELEVHFLNLGPDPGTRKPLEDVLPSARYYGVHPTPDRTGAFYSRFFPHEGTRIFLHTFGSPASADKMIFGREYKGEPLGEIDSIGIRVTDNGHFLVLTISRGVPPTRQDILLKDLRTPDAPFLPLVYGINSRFDELNNGDTFYVHTDLNAPNGRILKAQPGVSPDRWHVVIPETKDAIESANIVGGFLSLLRLHDVKSDLSLYTLEGKPAGNIAFPGIGAASNLSGRPTDKDGFYTFQSITTPPTIFHYDTVTGKSDVFASTTVPFNSADYEITQVFFPSKDGTRIPMFIAGKKGLKRDGTARLLMTGYGGFDLSETPTWNPEYAWWLQQGGFFALPNLRGGNEYGETWHKAAMFEHKQNVFDDWFAAAEYLIRNKYTSPEHFAIRGRSNGGLLMGASITQRPDLFGAIWCGYPLLDMLRYQRFLMGRTWTTEYGSAENPAQFPYIFKYSPYQNVHPGTPYPAILFFTGDGDTRVDPMNARKMTPLMQTASSSGRPILLHYSLKGGHSAGISQTQLIEDYADEMAFLWNETGPK